MADQPNNDVIAIVDPDTGARVQLLEDASNPDVELPVGLYQAEKFNAHGVKAAEPAILFRFRPSTLQRGKIALGEDLYLLMLLPNQRAPLPIELQVGPGSFQLVERAPESTILGLDGERLDRARPQLWTPDQGAPE